MRLVRCVVLPTEDAISEQRILSGWPERFKQSWCTTPLSRKTNLTKSSGERLRDELGICLYHAKKTRRAREIEAIRAHLMDAEKSGFTKLTAEQILAKSREKLERDGVDKS